MSGDAQRVGVAVVGTGFGCLTHVPALRAAGFDVLALVGRDPCAPPIGPDVSASP